MLFSSKVGVIVPAFNEGPRISRLLDVIVNVFFLDKIIVVDDGSEDNTSEVTGRYNVELIKHEYNMGKGAALQTGLNKMKDMDAVLFLDADLIGLKEAHLVQLLKPVLERHCAMSIGRFIEGRFFVDIQQRYFAILNGQRALSKEFINVLPDLSWSRFGVEVLLNKFANKIEAPMKEVLLSKITHVPKEEKFGLVAGFAARLKMYYEVITTTFRFSKKVPSVNLKHWSSVKFDVTSCSKQDTAV